MTGKTSAICLAIILSCACISACQKNQESAATSADTSAAAGDGKGTFTVSKETTVITSPLLADGAPNYLAALDALHNQGVTAENNGYALWLQVVGTRASDGTIPEKIRPQMLEALGMGETPPDAQVLLSYNNFLKSKKSLPDDAASRHSDDYTRARCEMWAAQDHPELAEYLSVEEKLLDRTAAAAAAPKWWLPALSGPGRPVMMEMLLPSLGQMRDATNALAARATLRADQGDFDGFLRDMIAIKELALHLGGESTIIERLVGYAINNVGDDAAATVLLSGKVTEAQCRTMAEKLAALPPMGDIASAVDVCERWDQLEIALILAADPDVLSKEIQILSSGSGRDVYGNMLLTIDRSAVDWDQVLRNLNKHTDEMVADLRAPTISEVKRRLSSLDQTMNEWQHEIAGATSLPKLESQSRDEYTQQVYLTLLAFDSPLFTNAEQNHRESIMRDDMVGVLLAAARQKATTGAWPRSPEELLAAGLKTFPHDIYSFNGEQPLKYVPGDAGPRIYSVGRNGVDNGGKTGNGADDIIVGPH